MRKYELTIIVKPDMDATALAAVLEKVKGYIAENHGNVVKTDAWGLRRLGYPIRKYREGQYVHFLTELEATAVARLESRVRLNEDILRHLLVIAQAPAPGKPAPEAAPVEAAPADVPAEASDAAAETPAA